MYERGNMKVLETPPKLYTGFPNGADRGVLSDKRTKQQNINLHDDEDVCVSYSKDPSDMRRILDDQDSYLQRSFNDVQRRPNKADAY